jgi:predicted dehydrogenase
MINRSDIGIGITGSGFMARTYAQCLERYTGRARLVAVAGGSRAPALAADFGIDFVEATDDLFGRDDVDAVIITTPEMVHREQTEKAASAGKHVLVEKPMAADLEACDAMSKACREAGIRLMVVQSQRFRGVHRRAHRIIGEGRIGRVQQVRFWGLKLQSDSLAVVKDKPFYRDPLGGGLYMGYAVHCFDMVRWMVGTEAESVYATVKSFGDHGVESFSTMAQIRFSGGAVAQVWICLEMPGESFPQSAFHTQIVGSEGLMDFDGYSYLDLTTHGKRERVWEQPPFDPTDPADPVRLESYSLMLQDFIDSVVEKREPSVTATDGRAAVELCLAALHSAETNSPVNLLLVQGL